MLPIAVATCGTLILLWLSGIVRGEVGRLWMYFGPLVVLIAVGWSEGDDSSVRSLPAGLVTQQRAASLRDSSRTTFYVLIIALVAAQLLIMNTRWLVNDSFLDEPPERSVVMNPQPMPFTASAEFADQIALRGYDARSIG